MRGTGLAIAANGAKDQTRIDVPQCLRAEAEPVQCPRLEILHKHVGARHEAPGTAGGLFLAHGTAFLKLETSRAQIFTTVLKRSLRMIGRPSDGSGCTERT